MGTGSISKIWLFSIAALAVSGCDYGKSTGVSYKPGYGPATLSPITDSVPSPTPTLPAPVLQAPSGLTYSANPASYQMGTAIPANNPAFTGGVPTAFVVSPPLPTGLLLNATSGSITGTPTNLIAATNYTVSASNSAGATQTILSISIATNMVAPTNLTYSPLTPVFSKGVAITNFAPTSQGGAPSAFAISATLPAGLLFNTNTGVISGTPTAVQAATAFTVTASNLAGSTTAKLTITVQELAPASVTYTSNPASYKVATLITANSPTTTGGVPTAYSVLPALPDGLVLNVNTGVITGTPTTATPAANYTVKATNGAGSAQVVLGITVVTNIVAPANLTYSNLAPVFTKGVQITSLTPTSQGGAPTSYTISPTLPAGLVFGATTGILSGTPTALSVMTPYLVTATNAGGSATATLAITVKDIPPATLMYSSPKIAYPKGVAIAANISLPTGGAITSYTINPVLPTGLSMNTTSGTITGTPTIPTLGTAFTITGINSGGSITTTITLGVADLADPNATYAYLQTNLLTPRCVNCHGAGVNYGDFTNITGLKARTIAGDPFSSSLYLRTAPGAANPMPPGGTITTVQSFAIMNWIAAGAPGAVTPSPTPTAPVGTTLLVGNDERLRIGNRVYIASVLQDIFGSSSTTPITNLISTPTYVDVLGGPCNAYSDIGRVDYGQITVGSDCASVASAQVQAIPVSTTARGALLTRTCDLILSQDAAVLNAASLALGTVVDVTSLPGMTSASVAKTYDLFYLGRPIDATAATQLLAVANSGENSLESWRFTLLTLCYAPDWQIP
jgi:hypothetical protein